VPQIKPDLIVTKFIIIDISTRNYGQFNIYVPVSGRNVDRFSASLRCSSVSSGALSRSPDKIMGLYVSSEVLNGSESQVFSY
jgi:hypothetical protein